MYLIELDDRAILIKIKEAAVIMDRIDPNDTDFIAAALVVEVDIWSDDKHFEKQQKVKVWKTAEIVKMLSYS